MRLVNRRLYFSSSEQQNRYRETSTTKSQISLRTAKAKRRASMRRLNRDGLARVIHLCDVMELMISTNKFQCFRKYCFKGNEKKKTLNQHQLANI